MSSSTDTMTDQQVTGREQALWRQVVIMRRKIERALEKRLQADASISVADFEILSTLCDAVDNRLRARDLADVLGWEKSRLSHQVTRMESRGLVRREECPTDLRGTWVVISDEGHQAAGRGMHGHDEVLREHFASLSDREQDELGERIARVIRAADPGACKVAEAVLRTTGS